jgi:hypothetical protein
VHGGTPAARIWRDGAAWCVATPGGTVTAERLIIGTNGYTGDLWPKLRQTLVPVFSGIAASEPVPEPIAEEMMPHRASVYEPGSVTTYYRIDRANRVLMGGRCPRTDITGVERLRFFIRYATRLWPRIAGIKWTHGWSDQLAVTPDHYPHIHRCRRPGAPWADTRHFACVRVVFDGRAASGTRPAVSMKLDTLGHPVQRQRPTDQLALKLGVWHGKRGQPICDAADGRDAHGHWNSYGASKPIMSNSG